MEIRFLKTFRPDWKLRSVYIWDVGRLALEICSRLLLQGVDVKGFVTDEPAFLGDRLLGRPILDAGLLRDDKDALILVGDSAWGRTLRKAAAYAESARFSDAMAFHPALYAEEPPLLYGVGTGCWELLKQFQTCGIEVRGFLETGRTVPNPFLGYEVRELHQITFKQSDRIVIAVGSEKTEAELLHNLEETGFPGTVYIRNFLPGTGRWGVDPFWLADRASREGKRILLCSEEAAGSALLKAALASCGIRVHREVCYEGDPDRGLEDIWSLADEDPGTSVLLGCALSEARRADLMDAAADLGYDAGKLTFACIQTAYHCRGFLTGKLAYELDESLPYSIDYSEAGGMPGWAVHGGGPGVRIAVTGGSTSAEVLFIESWVPKLYRRLQEEGIDAVIFNCAHEGDRVWHELLRLERDISMLKPDLVISMSGVNDLMPSNNKFEAVRKDRFAYWRQTELEMKAVAEAAGARFFAFLQPVNTCMETYTREEATFFLGDTGGMTKPFLYQSRTDDFYINLLTLFHHREGRFIDMVHYSGTANEELAQRVFETIREVLP